MLLNDDEIIRRIADDGLIKPHLAENVQGASYDLRLGKKCYVSTSEDQRTLTLSEDGGTVDIPSNAIFMFQTLEEVKLPSDIAGRLSLRMGLVRSGLTMPTQTQVDPGYGNVVFGMLYNLSDRPVQVSYGEHLVTIEFYKLMGEASKTYGDEYNDYVFDQFVSKHVTSALDHLSRRVKKSLATARVAGKQVERLAQRAEKDADKFMLIVGILSVLLAFLALIWGVSSVGLSCVSVKDLKQEVKELKKNLDAHRERLCNTEKEVFHLSRSAELGEQTEAKRPDGAGTKSAPVPSSASPSRSGATNVQTATQDPADPNGKKGVERPSMTRPAPSK